MNELTIYHFMPDKLNLYSDIGNIIALKQRAKLRNIKLNVVDVNETEGVTLDGCDIFFIGGGSDREQTLATKELSKIKKKFDKTFSEYNYNNNEWQSFELNIQEIHQEFIKRLSEQYPNLTAKDLKLCVFLRMNLSTKEIAPLMHLNYRSIELQRYRLRKKMLISPEINLNKFMINF